MLCTSGFMDDVTFGHNGPYGNAWKAGPLTTTTSGVAIPGRSLMSMNALFFVSYVIVLNFIIALLVFNI